MRLAVLAVFTAVAVVAAAPGADTPAASDTKTPDGWIDLTKPAAWKKVDPGWIMTDAVSLNPEKETRLKAEPTGGPIWVNGETGRLPNLYTKDAFGDCEVHIEFLVARRSNAGIKFHGVYEIQILDSAGTKKLSGDSCGGIYPRAEQKGGYHHIDDGIPPKVDAAKPAGEWQSMDVVWKSPRFDAAGKKTANAVVVKAVLNGKVVHENQELKTPTGNNWDKPETATGPFMFQADHGPVAFRNFRIKPAK